MIAVIGKTILYTLTAMGVISLGYAFTHQPHARPAVTDSTYLLKGCAHIQVAETKDSTYWQSDCKKPNVPWDSLVVRQ